MEGEENSREWRERGILWLVSALALSAAYHPDCCCRSQKGCHCCDRELVQSSFAAVVQLVPSPAGGEEGGGRGRERGREREGEGKGREREGRRE